MGIKLVSVLVVAFVVIAAGCGGGKKTSASPAPATTTSTVATTAGATTTTAAPTFASTKNCAQLLGLSAKFAQAFGASGTSITDEAKVFQAMAAAAPSEVRGDFQTLASAFSAYAQAFAKAGIKAGQTPTAAQLSQLQAAAKAFSGPKLRAAGQHLSAWGRKNCGGLTTTTTG